MGFESFFCSTIPGAAPEAVWDRVITLPFGAYLEELDPLTANTVLGAVVEETEVSGECFSRFSIFTADVSIIHNSI
ncbi:hypothetical protein G6F64_015088 [Rhizopus arrhizus]|uniref:Uncharacterized protein n=1 Tax=Rhizopus oryzae TaxID=64495 RepID=A0A9P6WSY8_RHIOR|nr:hypothetical protein G6F64_015088 [Rhizopus arrhizus]